jgi:hypothetical protein
MGSFGLLISNAGSGLGKGAGYVALAFFEAMLGAALAYFGKDLTGFAAVVVAVNAGVFGGGAWKAAAEAKNGAAKNN